MSSLTPDEARDVQGVLSLLGAEAVDLGDPAANHVTLNVHGRFRHNGLRVPVAATVENLIGWAKLLNQEPER